LISVFFRSISVLSFPADSGKGNVTDFPGSFYGIFIPVMGKKGVKISILFSHRYPLPNISRYH